MEVPLTNPKYEIIDTHQIGEGQLVPMNPQHGPPKTRWVVNPWTDLNGYVWIYYDEDKQDDAIERRRR